MTDPSLSHTRARTLLIGVGNTHRGDDGIGPAIVKAVADAPPEGVDCVIESGEATRLMEAWQGYDAVLIVDAAAMDAPPGILIHLDPLAEDLPAVEGDPSSHGLGVPEAVRLSAALGTLPATLKIISINGEDFGHKTTLSPALAERLPRFVQYTHYRLRQLAGAKVPDAVDA
ncbi:MAG: hydrogenase maturation protease [Pseudomonadota bacterium]